MNLNSLLNSKPRLELARRNFWEFCKLIAPEFYREDRPHLKEICDTLQALYEGRIVRYNGEDTWQLVPKGHIHPSIPIVCKKLMMNIPPQHGKTRTLVNFSSWVFGKNVKEKIITASYNDSTASDFSRYCRDAIAMEKNVDEDTEYKEIFPLTRLKYGNKAFEKWALEGQHFSYLGVGIGGSVTSKGGTILIVDDAIKNAEDALNENNLDRIWLWYTSTFQSRVAAEQGEPIEIVCMTRWSKLDICGRILDSDAAKDWYVLKMVAYNKEKDTMLCASLFGKKRYMDLRVLVEPGIFEANYNQETLDRTGVLFKQNDLKRFKLADIKNDKGEDIIPESILAYVDVADEGDDYYAMVVGKIFMRKVFITRILFTRENVDVSLPLTAEIIKSNQVDYCRVEVNGSGSLFVKMIRQYVSSEKILEVNNHTAKHSRVLQAYGFIKKFFYFLETSEYESQSDYDLFMKNLFGYMKDGSSKHDDAPDCAAGLSLLSQNFLPHLFEIEEVADVS